jgi:5'-nucleotidase
MIEKTILVTNDDGIYTDGIYWLWEAVKDFGNALVVAPDTEKSAVGHAITITNPLRTKYVNRRGGFSGYAVNGTPADCVKIAVRSILNSPPDLVVSGINYGANVGTNVIYSGTVSAATEGTIFGIPSIAVSIDSHHPKDFKSAMDITQNTLKKVLKFGLPEGTLLNVNVPDIPDEKIKGTRITTQGNAYFKDRFEKREDPRGNIYYWMTGESIDPDSSGNTDRMALKDGYISVTPIHYRLTNESFMSDLESWEI